MGATPNRLAGEPPVRLALHKEKLLALLRAAYKDGPRSRPLDLKFAWRLIEVFGDRRRLEEAWGSQVEKADERRSRALEIAEACCQARELLQGATQKRPNGFMSGTGAGVIRGLAGDFADPFLQWEHGWQKIRHALESLAAIERAARDVSEQNRRGRGVPTGGGELPTTQVEHLAMIFSQITVSKPTSTETGPFMGFVRAVRDALDIPLGDDGVRRVVLIGLRQSKGAARKPAK
jgi:hypothetical protein